MEYLDCGCIVQTMCPLHAQAEGMLACLREFMLRLNTHSRPYLAGDPLLIEAWIAQARAILRAVEGK